MDGGTRLTLHTEMAHRVEVRREPSVDLLVVECDKPAVYCAALRGHRDISPRRRLAFTGSELFGPGDRRPVAPSRCLGRRQGRARGLAPGVRTAAEEHREHGLNAKYPNG